MAAVTRTIVFADQVASTAALVRTRPHRADQDRRRLFSALRAAVAQPGLQVVKELGDGVMAVFESARAGLDAAREVRQTLGAEVRVGVSSGDVSMDDGDCFGLGVVEAQRLCALAAPGQILVSESTRLLARPAGCFRRLEAVQLKGLAELSVVAELLPARDARPLRVLVADDVVLVREGLTRLLEEVGIDVVGQAGDADELLRLAMDLRPDLAIVDVRMPPTWTDEGLRAAEEILAADGRTGVLVLSQDIQPRYAERLRAACPPGLGTGVGYLLKEEVRDLTAFAAVARHVAAGGTALETTQGADL